MPKVVVDIAELYDTNEAADLIGIGYATLFRWIKKGKLIPIRIAGRTLIPRSEVERLQQEKLQVGNIKAEERSLGSP